MLRFLLLIISVLGLATRVLSQSGYPQCNRTETAYCSLGSLQSNIIFRCLQSSGSSSPGNCWDNVGSMSAYCWQSSSGAGDAKCVKDCTLVTAANGTTFYPLGCSTNNATSSRAGGPVSTQLPVSSSSISSGSLTRASASSSQAATTTMTTSAAATSRSDATSCKSVSSSWTMWYSFLSTCLTSVLVTQMFVL